MFLNASYRSILADHPNLPDTRTHGEELKRVEICIKEIETITKQLKEGAYPFEPIFPRKVLTWHFLSYQLQYNI